jgi:putative FmdB family regulatory protein
MPLYTYYCGNCELEIEERRPFDQADEPLECPVCAAHVKRVITVGFVLSKNKAVAGVTEQYGKMTAGKRHKMGCICCS